MDNNNKKENENIYQEILNKLNKENSKKTEKNFSQQVDFLYHKEDPEGQSSIKNILIKQYKNKKIIQNERNKKNSEKKKIIPYSNKNKGLFDPYLTQKELDYKSNIEKQRQERQKKIDEYKKNKSRQKLKQNLEKKIINFEKSSKTPKNIVKINKNKINSELLTHFNQMTKPKIKKNIANKFAFNPKKYDIIINSLFSEMNKDKIGDIKNYAKNNIDKYNNYYEYVYKNNINNFKQKKSSYNKTNENKIKKPTRAEIIKGLMQKYFGEENNKQQGQINNKGNKKQKIIKEVINDDKNNNNNIVLNTTDNKEDIINFENIDKLLSSEKINFQDKINIIFELNKNIDKYSQAMPFILNQVQNSLNEIYNKQSDIYFRKEINKIPYIAMASKTAYQIIQTNNDIIIETIIDELLFEFALNLMEIKQKKEYIIKKKELINEFNLTKNKIDDIIHQEKNILEENIKFIEDNKGNSNNNMNNINNINKVVIKRYESNLDENIIKRNDKYKNDFKEYMVFKGSFYAENIFNIYDEFIEEEAERLLDKIVNNFVEQLNIK